MHEQPNNSLKQKKNKSFIIFTLKNKFKRAGLK